MHVTTGQRLLAAITVALSVGLFASVFAAPEQAPSVDPGRMPLRRLTRYEYNRSVRDLFGFDFDLERFLQKDNSNDGFTNNAALAFATPDRVRQYLAASQFVADTVTGLNDVLTFRNHRWGAEDILAQNPNLSLMNRLGRFFADRRGHVRARQRAPDPPRLQLVTVRTRDRRAVRALDVPPSSSLIVRNDFPLTGSYTISVLAASRHPRGDETIKIVVDGEPVPVRIGLSPSDATLQSYVVPLHIPRGRRSLKVSVPSGGHIVLASLDVSGPMISERPAPDQRQHLAATLPCVEPAGSRSSDVRDCAEKTVRYLASRAFRQADVDDADLRGLLLPFQRAVDNGRTFRQGLSLSIQAILLSPRFVYRVEGAESDRRAAGRRSDFELAARLSYFLWGSLPDERLRQLAARGWLASSPAAIRTEVARMLLDRRADAMVEAFAAGWLGYGGIRTHVADKGTFPRFDEELRQAMLTETELYLSAFFRENWPISALIDSPTLFLNDRLAAHYGLGALEGPRFRRVESTVSARGGLLAQGSILTLTSNSNRTSVVQRGLWIMRNVLCESVGDPPPNVTQLPEQPQRSSTMHQQMEAHRRNPACASCHRRIDPPGFGLENFDGIGMWRSADNGTPIDPGGTFVTKSGPQAFRDFPDLRRLLTGDDRVPLCVTQKLMTYALGRSLTEADEAAAKDVVARTESGGHRIHDVIAEIAVSPPFRGTPR